MLLSSPVSLLRRSAIAGYQEMMSIAIAPLEGPKRLLGLLIFMDTRAQAFLYGECLLIEQYRLLVSKNVEQALQAMIVTEASATRHEIVTDVQEQSEFIALVSHELRTPLTDIRGYAELLQAYAVSDQEMHRPAGIMEMTAERQQQYLNVIVEQTNHLEVLISDLLDVSRLCSRRLALRHSWIDIGELCQRIAQIMQDKIERQQPGYYRISCKREIDLPLAWADPHRVQQVLINLLENAVKYSPDGGVIQIQVSTVSLCARRMLCVAVSDQGIGVPSQQQLSLFQLFTRLGHPSAG
ncbi:MAG: cell wall metabolism sensor histidine kinase WalK [Chloroflexi bacterium]|nr:MAG: cell wall metabolism sensor histidine kinase WalK [Chloroflexota bacterium]